ncbi:hypothetical protein UK23_04430 [Lentzea aerocolonigenes]|uniref:Uncharacterized protein n=1 Tax=Lentzea aerocolonigenes TaxID=68170 RepID=A0A0F0HBE1_LENAE|nr:hypothetical protein UK23_04430 [Lentzea aerocolonigenes]
MRGFGIHRDGSFMSTTFWIVEPGYMRVERAGQAIDRESNVVSDVIRRATKQRISMLILLDALFARLLLYHRAQPAPDWSR